MESHVFAWVKVFSEGHRKLASVLANHRIGIKIIDSRESEYTLVNILDMCSCSTRTKKNTKNRRRVEDAKEMLDNVW